jgi:hypothetical protein
MVRLRNHARTLRERDGKDEPLTEVDGNDDNDEYNKDSDIPNDDDKYAVGLTVSTSPLTRATKSMIFSALPPRERALRISGQACPHAESIMLCSWDYFSTYLGYLPTIPTSPKCDTFQLIPVSF